MLDLKWIRENPNVLDAAMARRKVAPVSANLISLDTQRRTVQTELQELQARRNEAAKAIGKAKSEGENADALIKEVADLKSSVQHLEVQERDLGEKMKTALSVLPNILQDDVPDGESEEDNLELNFTLIVMLDAAICTVST